LELWWSTDCKFPDDGLVKPKHVRAFIVYFNVNFNISNQINCALVRLIKDWINKHILQRKFKNLQPTSMLSLNSGIEYINSGLVLSMLLGRNTITQLPIPRVVKLNVFTHEVTRGRETLHSENYHVLN
jgi:hypothetical protein